MVRWPTSRSRLHPFKAHLSQIERIDKHDNNANKLLSSVKSSRHSGNTDPLAQRRPHQILPQNHRVIAKQ